METASKSGNQTVQETLSKQNIALFVRKTPDSLISDAHTDEDAIPSLGVQFQK
jgi:hypothetical protein